MILDSGKTAELHGVIRFVGLSRATACALCLALAAVAGNTVAKADEAAEEVPPLSENRQALEGTLWWVQHLGEIGWGPHALPFISPSTTVMPSVTGVGRLAQSGLDLSASDEVSLSKFVRTAIETRVQELGLSERIKVRYPDAWHENGKVNCDQLRMEFELQSREVELAQGRAIVVVINLVAVQGAREYQQDRTVTCLDGHYPPRMQRD